MVLFVYIYVFLWIIGGMAALVNAGIKSARAKRHHNGCVIFPERDKEP